MVKKWQKVMIDLTEEDIRYTNSSTVAIFRAMHRVIESDKLPERLSCSKRLDFLRSIEQLKPGRYGVYIYIGEKQ